MTQAGGAVTLPFVIQNGGHYQGYSHWRRTISMQKLAYIQSNNYVCRLCWLETG
nr:hypothetical protein [Escherichia coli]